MKKKFLYPLLSNAFSKDDINIGISVLRSKQITMSKLTEKFEKYFAKKMGSKFAVMTNSGSSANLLAFSCITNPLNNKNYNSGDEVIIPAVCWSTSLWPIYQNNLNPVFVDVELDTFNIDVDEIEKKITKKTKAILIIHVLGTSANMDKLLKISKKYKLDIIEDTCESLGAKYKNKKLGTFGRFGTYSFYYSHQITSGEGGMVVCDNSKDYNILKSLRSHGWARGTNLNKKFKINNKYINSNFLFVGPGYNLRPMDIQAAIAHNQFNKLNYFMKVRNDNRNKIINNLRKNKKWNNQFTFVEVKKNISPSWFGLPIMVNKRYHSIKEKFLKFLSDRNIENRPIISGNFLNQPAAKLYKLKYKHKDFINSNLVEKGGFFIGLHTKKISQNELNYLTDSLLEIDNIK